MSFVSSVAAAISVAVVGGGALIGCAALGVFGTEFNFRMTEHYSPKYEQVRRTTFEQSQAYQEGARRDIENLKLDWVDASPEKKATIRALALERINSLPEGALTSSIVSFRNELMGQNQ